MGKNKSRTIHLCGGSEEGYAWEIKIDVSVKQQGWGARFYLADRLRKARQNIRSNDRAWAERSFPRRWRQQFEIHHDWKSGEACYFLTREAHHALHQA